MSYMFLYVLIMIVKYSYNCSPKNTYLTTTSGPPTLQYLITTSGPPTLQLQVPLIKQNKIKSNRYGNIFKDFGQCTSNRSRHTHFYDLLTRTSQIRNYEHIIMATSTNRQPKQMRSGSSASLPRHKIQNKRNPRENLF